MVEIQAAAAREGPVMGVLAFALVRLAALHVAEDTMMVDDLR